MVVENYLHHEVNYAYAYRMSGSVFAPIPAHVSGLFQPTAVQVFRYHTSGVDVVSGQPHDVGFVAASG